MPKLNRNSHSFKNSGKDLRSIPLYLRNVGNVALFTPQVEKISLQDLKRRIAVQTAVRLHRVIEINKAAQLLLPVFRTVKLLFSYHISIRVRITRSALPLVCGRATLTNPVLITGLHRKHGLAEPFIFRTVVGVNALNQVWTGINQVSSQKLGGTVCGFVRQNGGV